jgi:hypothetical protein
MWGDPEAIGNTSFKISEHRNRLLIHNPGSEEVKEYTAP